MSAATSECLFCKIARKEIPATLVYEDDSLLAFKDIFPQAPVHLLLIPKAHCESLADMTPAIAEVVGRLLQVAPRLAQEHGVAASGWRLLTNAGPDSGQTVFHLHFHLLGGKPLGGKLCL